MTSNKTLSKSPNKGTKAEIMFTDTLTRGTPLYLACGLTPEHLDKMYASAYTLYAEKHYSEALKMFEGMAFYNHLDKRGWIGSAACYQIFKRYEDAIFSYFQASIIDANDPLPLFYTSECYIALKEYDKALPALEAAQLLIKSQPAFAFLQDGASKMRNYLQAAH